MSIVNREDIIKLLPIYTDLLDATTLYAIEQALGFELTPSQISLIVTDEMRYTGRTTAEAIRDYLWCLKEGKKSVDYHVFSPVGLDEVRHKASVIQRLMDAGFPEIEIKIGCKR